MAWDGIVVAGVGAGVFIWVYSVSVCYCTIIMLKYHNENHPISSLQFSLFLSLSVTVIKQKFCIFISHHTTVARYYGILFGVCWSIHPHLFPDNSYSFHQIALKLVGQLDIEMVQRIFFEVMAHQVLIVITLFEDFFRLDFVFQIPPTVFFRSGWNMVDSWIIRWCSAYCFDVTGHQIMIEL